jgi:PIN domain nuclease of toxin-antitoxin system
VASLLLDTCTLLWLAADPSRLSSAATQALDDEANELSVSDVSTLEIALKWSAGKLTLPAPPRMWFESQVSTWGLSTIGLRRADIYRTTELPSHHRDPFDRLLVAQALDRDLTIVTPDEAVAAYPVATLW